MPAQSNSLLLSDPDTQETREWLDALKAVIEHEGPERAHYLIERLVDLARRSGINLPYRATTAYVNTIAPGQQTPSPGNHELEHRIRSYVRWNALAMVVRANREDSSSAGISPPSPPRRRSTTSASTISGTPLRPNPRRRSAVPGPLPTRASTRVPSCKAADEGADEQLPPRSRRRGHVELSAPVADARLLAVPHGIDGPGSAQAIYQARFMKYLE
jgi:pyruvate dehydrogenase E1 component